jgi:hypothetical protein
MLAADTADTPMLRLLVELGADPTLTNADGCTPLMAAAGLGTRSVEEEAGTEEEAVEAVTYLLSLGADIDAVSKHGDTAMHGAAFANFPAVVKLLDARGARLEVWNRPNERGWTPLLVAEGHRFGNFKPGFSTIAAIHDVLRAHGLTPPPLTPPCPSKATATSEAVFARSLLIFLIRMPTPFLRLVSLLVLTFSLATRAQSASDSTVEGRVQNAITGDYLQNARISIRGSDRVVLTDEGGQFRLAGLPTGNIALRVRFAGFADQEIPVTLTAGATTVQDFKLGPTPRPDDATGALRMDAFTVQSKKETDAAAIAVNEQRVALGQKSVISADQFGTIPDSNPGELMKFLPGVSVEYFANNIVGVSVRGFDATSTEIRFDGLPTASASTATLGTGNRDRNFEMMGASSADISRVEVRLLRTPEDSANAIGGSINMIRRSSFEASRSHFTYNALFTTDHESLSLGSRAGIRDTRLPGWRPNFKLTWTDPVSREFRIRADLQPQRRPRPRALVLSLGELRHRRPGRRRPRPHRRRQTAHDRQRLQPAAHHRGPARRSEAGHHRQRLRQVRLAPHSRAEGFVLG